MPGVPRLGQSPHDLDGDCLVAGYWSDSAATIFRLEFDSAVSVKIVSDNVTLEMPNVEIINESDIEPDRIEWNLPFRRLDGQ